MHIDWLRFGDPDQVHIFHLCAEHTLYRWQVKISSSVCHWQHAGSVLEQGSSPTYSSDTLILELCSAGHAVSQVSMSQAGSMCDLLSHMLGGVWIREVLCCSGRSPWSQGGDSAARGGCKVSVEGLKPGHLLSQRSPNFCLSKGYFQTSNMWVK